MTLKWPLNDLKRSLNGPQTALKPPTKQQTKDSQTTLKTLSKHSQNTLKNPQKNPQNTHKHTQNNLKTTSINQKQPWNDP